MAGKGTKILSSDYNSMQSTVSQVLGNGDGSNDYGYGQSVASSQVSINSKISVAQWSNLRTDLLRCVQHQTNVSYSGSIPVPTTASTITSEVFDAYKAVADVIGPNRLTLPAGQATLETLSTTTRTSAWNGSITQTVTLSFPQSSIYTGHYGARHFFNSGGRIQFSASRTGGTSNTKNSTWTTLLQNMGTIYFDYTSTTCTGSGATTSLGFYDLTTSNQTIFAKDLGVGASYYPNKYYINARLNNTSTKDQVIFTIYFADLSAQPNPPWGTDENVDGTLTSTVQMYRATGSNVSVTAPSVVATSIA